MKPGIDRIYTLALFFINLIAIGTLSLASANAHDLLPQSASLAVGEHVLLVVTGN